MTTVEELARFLYLRSVEAEGFPNGLPTWEEMAKDRSIDRRGEFVRYAMAAMEFMQARSEKRLEAAE